MKRSRKQRFARFVVFSFLLLAVGAAAWVARLLSSSSPAIGRTLNVPGLHAEVRIEQDDTGMATIEATNTADLFRAQGWLTARDRFFQMDLIRRRTGGRLAEIFGRGLLKSDRVHRTYGFANVARQVADEMDPSTRVLAQAYADGVNAFLSQGPLPFEVRVLRYQPEPWSVSDTILVILSMYESLNHYKNEGEAALTALYAALPGPLVDFLTPEHGFLDAPLKPDPPGLKLTAVPPPDVFDLRRKAGSASMEKAPEGRLAQRERDEFFGSNAWAVAGTRTASGKPLLAGDPHLHLSAPNIWYRVRLKAPDLQVAGLSLPGVAGVVIGSNGKVAWSFTNPNVDNVDFIDLPLATDKDHYLKDGQTKAFHQRVEKIEVRSSKAELLTVRDSPWGPVLEEKNGKVRVVQWAALDTTTLRDLDILSLDRAKNLDEMLEALSRWVGPPQNAMIATQDGHIAWALVGHFPRRVGFDGRTVAPRDKTHDWKGYLSTEELPRVIDPPSGYLVSANQRTVPVDHHLFQYGNDWPSPARAYRLRELLESRKDWTAAGMQELQLDILSRTHLWYREQLKTALKGSNGESDPWIKAVAALIPNWDGRAEESSTSYPLIRTFRLALFDVLLKPLISRLDKDDQEDAFDLVSRDAVVKAMLEQRPSHLLAPIYKDYDEAVRAAAVKAAKELTDRPERLSTIQWGDLNRSQIRHPFAFILPGFLASYFNMPEVSLSGDHLVPRVCRPSHGASMRMVVDLADADQSFFSQPGGQSGHPWSAHYRDLFRDWANGRPRRFLPGVTVAVDVLKPG